MTAVLSERVVVNDVRNEGGYAPELKRSLSSFQMFAISFASVSVVIGVFSTYNDVLQNSGPVGLWLFPIVAVGQILVALVYAQFAARIPLSGSSYQWASRLANPKIGWIFGWIAVCNVGLSVVDIDNAMASQCLMPLFNMAPSEVTARVIRVILLVIQAIIVIASVRIVGLTNSLAVGVELAIVVVLGIAFADEPGLDAEPVLTGHCGGRSQLLRVGRRIDGGADHGPVDAGRLRRRREHGRGSEGSVPQRSSCDRRISRRGRGLGFLVRHRVDGRNH
jgi:hypothetical protein